MLEEDSGRSPYEEVAGSAGQTFGFAANLYVTLVPDLRASSR